MPEPRFDKLGCIKFIDYEGKSCYLTRETWSEKTKYPERSLLKFNFDKIRLTITYPEEVRRSSKNRQSKILYRKFDRINYREGVNVPFNGYFVVVINQSSGRIQTIYPTKKKKRGEKLWPK